MNITEAYEVLHKHYPEYNLQYKYMNKNLDGSESDSYKKLDYNAELLRKIAMKEFDKKEQKKCYDAADVFESEARKGRFLM